MGLKLIGITGKARSGKDTLARLLVEEHGFHRMAFADPVKKAAAIAFGWPESAVFQEEFKEWHDPYWDLTVREALQRFGTEAVRGEFGDDFWIKRWLYDYTQIKKHTSVVVSDVRTDLEAMMIRIQGGVIVHLNRQGAGLSGKEGQHSSEQGIVLGPRDIEVANNGTINDLFIEACKIVGFIETHAADFSLRNELQD